MPDFTLSRTGLEIEAPVAGDIVTVKIRPPAEHRPPTAPQKRMSPFGGLEWTEWENPQHYRINAIWRVVATNGGNAVVEQIWPKQCAHDDRREVWSIARHRWFEASELLAAVRPSEEDRAPDAAPTAAHGKPGHSA